MKVVVNTPNSISVKINEPQQEAVHGTSTFVGASSQAQQIQGAYNTANTALQTAQTASTVANTAIVQVGSSYNEANAAYALANTKYSANGGALYGNMVITGNITPATDNTYSLGTANSKFKSLYVSSGTIHIDNISLSSSGGSLQIANSASMNISGGLAVSGNISANGIYDSNIELLAYSNTINAVAQASYNQANASNILAQAAFTQANNVYTWANTINVFTQSAYNLANSTNSSLANVATLIQPAFNQANAAFNKANNSLANTTGTFAGDLTITGNLVVSGTTITVNTEIVNQQEVVTGKLTANAGIASVNTNTGSLIVLGGVGVSGNVYANGIYDSGIELLAYANTINAVAQAAYNATNNIVVIGNTINLGTNTSGQLVSNAVSLTATTSVTNGIAQMNQILGKLVPASPPTFPGAYGTLTITGLVGPYRMTNFTQQDNTGLATSPVVAGGTSVSPLRTSTYTTSTIYLINTQAGDVMTVYKNNASSGTRTMTAGATNAGSYGDLRIITNVDYASTGAISYANFWYSANVNATGTVANGWNTIYITDTSGTKTANATWYYDNSAPGSPTFASPTIVPLSPSLTYSSTVPHYNSSTTFRLGVTVSKLSGDMYPASDTFFTGAAGGAFGAPASNTYTGVSITTPLARNLYVASGNVVVNTTSTIIAGFGSSSTGPSVTVDNSYSTASQVFTTALANTVLYKTGTASAMEETGFIASGFGTAVGSGNAVRIVNYDGGTAVDTPTFSAGQTAFNSQTGTFYTTDATVVAGVLKNDTTNYSVNYLPPGPNLSSQGAAQYITLRMTRSSVSKFSINYTTSTGIGGIWCAMPAQTSYSAANNWYSMTVDNSLAGGCALGGNLVPASTGAKVYNCQFAGLNSSNATNNEILVRIRLNTGQSITALSFAASTI
jgi:hypothetical protein